MPIIYNAIAHTEEVKLFKIDTLKLLEMNQDDQ